MTSQRLPYHVSCKGNPKSEALWSLFCLVLDTTALGQAIQAVRLSCVSSTMDSWDASYSMLCLSVYTTEYIYISGVTRSMPDKTTVCIH